MSEKRGSSQYEALAMEGLEQAKAMGASYADLRVVEEETRCLGVRMGRVSQLSQGATLGMAVRVLVEGAWGHAAAPDLSQETALSLAERACRAARAGAGYRKTPAILAPLAPQVGEFRSPYEEDPFEVSIEEQFALLMETDRLLGGDPKIRSRSASMDFLRERNWFYSSEGSKLFQETLRSGAGFSVTAVGNGEVQTRSYPANFGGNFVQRGYEHVRALDLPGHAEEYRDQALALLTADPCPSGTFDLILGGGQLALQIHESVGHPNEFDRVLGFEADLAGRSFVTPEKRGNFRYGSDIVNLVADSGLEGGLATLGWDDDGVPAQRWHVVEAGIHRNYLTNREFATRLGDPQSFGANRAWGWRYPPQIRIPNLSLMPGEAGRLDDLFAESEGAIFFDTVKTWSIDQMRLNFQFTCEIAWEIKGGRRARLLRNPTYQGMTPQFWGSCDAICGEEEWRLWGVPNCGKGQPMQLAEMTHACSPARFRRTTLL